MDEGIKAVVALDVDKDSIALGVADAAGGAGQFMGRIACDLAQLLKMLKRLGGNAELKLVYEAGPTG